MFRQVLTERMQPEPRTINPGDGRRKTGEREETDRLSYNYCCLIACLDDSYDMTGCTGTQLDKIHAGTVIFSHCNIITTWC